MQAITWVPPTYLSPFLALKWCFRSFRASPPRKSSKSTGAWALSLRILHCEASSSNMNTTRLLRPRLSLKSKVSQNHNSLKGEFDLKPQRNPKLLIFDLVRWEGAKRALQRLTMMKIKKSLTNLTWRQRRTKVLKGDKTRPYISGITGMPRGHRYLEKTQIFSQMNSL